MTETDVIRSIIARGLVHSCMGSGRQKYPRMLTVKEPKFKKELDMLSFNIYV